MYLLDRLRTNPELLGRAVRDPALLGLGLNRLYHGLRRNAAYNDTGTDVFADEDWDNLILLDACRADVYAERTPFDGPLSERESRGSASRQFVTGNFRGKTLHDVVYVSGNRWYLNLEDELDCELHAYRDVERDAAGGFVPSAEAVTEAALEANERYPNKRLLVHYMQPHYPYLGSEDASFELVREGLRQTVRESPGGYEAVREAYRENLDYVLDHLEPLLDELVGKTVISADHGEMLGDRLSPVPVRWVGHPPGIFVDELVSVPWHVVSEGPRKDVVAEAPEETAVDADREDVEETLRNLGYVV